MTKYCLGFVFDTKNEAVLLQRKTEPIWQRGKYNGIGAKIEPDDPSPTFAMNRESKEETGQHFDWRAKFLMCVGDDVEVYVHKTNSNFEKMNLAREFSRNHTPEPCDWFYWRELSFEKFDEMQLLRNLYYMIPMLADDNFVSGNIRQLGRTK